MRKRTMGDPFKHERLMTAMYLYRVVCAVNAWGVLPIAGRQVPYGRGGEGGNGGYVCRREARLVIWMRAGGAGHEPSEGVLPIRCMPFPSPSLVMPTDCTLSITLSSVTQDERASAAHTSKSQLSDND